MQITASPVDSTRKNMLFSGIHGYFSASLRVDQVASGEL